MQALVGQNNTPWYGVQWGTSQNVRQGGATGEWNLGWGWNTPTQHLVDAWGNTDPRKNQTILYSGQFDGGATEGGYGATVPPYNKDSLGKAGFLDQPYWSKKVYSDPEMRAFTGEIGSCCGGADWINHRILRYADVLLMLAEASNEKGDGATAAARLEEVRARSRNSGTDATALPWSDFGSVPPQPPALGADPSPRAESGTPIPDRTKSDTPRGGDADDQ